MGIFTRKARDAKDVFRVDLGGMPRGFSFTPDQPRPSLPDIARRYGRWVWLCSSINGRVAASVRPRLFMLGNKGVVEKCADLRPKPLDRATRAFLNGRGDVTPSARVMKRVQGNIDDMTEVTAHPALDLLDDVNPWMEGFSFRQGLYVDLQVFGRAFTQLVQPSEGAPPDELWRLQPQYMNVLSGGSEFVTGYLYKNGIQEKTYTPDEVFWIKMFDPHNPWGGVGWVEAFLKTVDADLSIVDFTDWMFKNGGTPDLVVTTAVEPNEDYKRSYRQQFMGLFGNLSRRATNVLFASGKDTKVEKFANSPREMEYVKGREIARDEVCAAAGVPKSYVTTDDVNLANAREGSITHMRVTVWPMIQVVEEAINQRLLPLWDDRLILIHDNPIQDDRELRIQERASMLGAGYSINELRIQDGEEPLDDPQAEVPMIAAGFVPLSMAGMSAFGGLGGLGGGLAFDEDTGEAMPAEGDEVDDEAAGDAPVPEGEQSGAVQTNDLRATVGGSAAILALQQAYYDGAVPRDAAIANATLVFGFTPDEANTLFPELPPDAPKSDEQVAREEAELDAMRNPPEPGEPDAPPLPPKALECDHEHGELSQKALWTKDDDRDKPHRDEAQRRSDERAKHRGEPAFGRALRRILTSQARELVSAMGEMGVNVSIDRAVEILADSKWGDAIAAAARPQIERMVLEGGTRGLERLGLEVSFDAANPRVQEFVDNYTARLASTAQETTTVAVRDLLGDGLEKGETIAELRERVRTWAEGDPATGQIGTAGHRAEMIARTESARAYERGQEVAWKETGVVSGKLWLASPGACEFCQAAAQAFNDEAKAVPLGASFFAKGTTLKGTQGGTLRLDYEAVEGPPLHPHCTCALTAVLNTGGTE